MKGIVKVDIACPRVPNFINVNGTFISLSKLPEDAIDKLADEWKIKLKQRREEMIRSKI